MRCIFISLEAAKLPEKQNGGIALDSVPLTEFYFVYCFL